MKKLFVLLIALFVLNSLEGYGQINGSTCNNPLVVNSLPFNDAGNTSTYGSNYLSSDVPPLATGAITNGTGSNSYLSGDEVVYAYTPICNQVVTITTTNDDDWIGLWAFTGCSFSSTVGYHTSISGATRSIVDLPLTGGETYYFVISTWSAPQSTNYTINITLVSDDCPVSDPTESCDMIYVDGTNGNDSNTGTADNPVKTLARAMLSVSPSRNYIKMTTGTYAENTIINLQDDLVIDGRYTNNSGVWSKSSNTAAS